MRHLFWFAIPCMLWWPWFSYASCYEYAHKQFQEKLKDEAGVDFESCMEFNSAKIRYYEQVEEDVDFENKVFEAFEKETGSTTTSSS